MDLIEIFESDNKIKLYEAFAEFVQKYWKRIEPKRTLEELVEKGMTFIKEVDKLPHIVSSKLVGSVKHESTHPYSVVDIKIRRSSCPGKKNCFVNKLINEDRFEKVDIYCHPEKK